MTSCMDIRAGHYEVSNFSCRYPAFLLQANDLSDKRNQDRKGKAAKGREKVGTLWRLREETDFRYADRAHRWMSRLQE